MCLKTQKLVQTALDAKIKISEENRRFFYLLSCQNATSLTLNVLLIVFLHLMCGNPASFCFLLFSGCFCPFFPSFLHYSCLYPLSICLLSPLSVLFLSRCSSFWLVVASQPQSSSSNPSLFPSPVFPLFREII